MIIGHVLKVAAKENYSNGLMTKNGIFEYPLNKEFVKDIEETSVIEESA